jgi:tRNA pseudouridine55 synthase
VDLNGVLLINKDVGWTSFETVNQVKKRLGARKAGHAGTLDKSASGLLLVCVNGATAVQELLMGQFKRYRGTVRFGIETDTLDRYGSVVTTGVPGFFSGMELLEVLGRFRGIITQEPPRFSALHQEGKRLYRMALRGEQVSVKPRNVEIREIRLVENMPGGAVIEVVASKGTYVRSLARDIAAALGTCGYLSQLHRLSVGPFSVEQALHVDEIDERVPIIPLRDALRAYPHLELTVEAAVRVRNGMPVWRVLEKAPPSSVPSDGYLCLSHQGSLIAVVRMKPKPRYLRVFP